MRAISSSDSGRPSTAAAQISSAVACRRLRAARSSVSATATSCWNSGFVASGDAASSGTLPRGEGEDVVERAAGDAEGHARHHERDERGGVDAGDGLVDARLALERHEGPIGRNAEVVDPEVVAGGGAHAGRGPRVLDDDVIGREQRGAEHGMAVDEPFDAVAVDPVGVLAPAGEPPSALDPVAAVDRCDRPGRVEGAGHDDAGPCREDSVEGGAGQGDEIAPGAAADHHDPCDRRVRGGEVLVQAHGGHDVGARAAVAGGDEHAEAARRR